MDVFCKHRWTPHGPNACRCEICRKIWRDTSKTDEPKVAIGYCEAQEWDGTDRRKEVLFRTPPRADLQIE